MTLGNLPVRRSSDTGIGPHSRLFALLYGETKTGKTKLGASIDLVTQKYMDGARALVLASELAAGAGLDAAREYDVPYVELDKFDTIGQTLAAARNASLTGPDGIGAIVWDAATEWAKHYAMPHSTKLKSSKVNEAQRVLRDLGIPQDPDYQNIPEFVRRPMAELAWHHRKGRHIIITANMRPMTNERREVVSYMPDFPGRVIERTVLSMATQIGHVDLVRSGKDLVRTVSFGRSNLHPLLADRMGAMPDRFAGKDLLELYEAHWLPKFARKEAAS